MRCKCFLLEIIQKQEEQIVELINENIEQKDNIKILLEGMFGEELFN